MLDPNVGGAIVVGAAMGLEWAVGRAKGQQLYRLADTLSNLGTSMGQLALQAMLGFTLLSLYDGLEGRLGLLEWDEGSALAWLAGFVLCELCFYWRHRAGHEVHLFWCVHSVHHQSPDFNLGVGNRVGWLQWAQTSVFVLPLAALGLPVAMFATLFAGIHLYNLLLHTVLIDRLGPLEAVLMTPSHHRVHHGRNPRYLDKNYGFTVIVLDRLFGTYEVEDEAPAWGTNAGLHTWSPLDNNLRPWARMLDKMRAAPTWATALQVPWRPPAWDPATGRTELPTTLSDREVPADAGAPGVRLAVAAWLGFLALATAALVQSTPTWPPALRVVVGALVLAGTTATHLLTRPSPRASVEAR